MDHIEEIAERIRRSFDSRTAARDRALTQARALTRFSAETIRAAHRNERSNAQETLGKARNLVELIRNDLVEYPDLYYAGYTQDALKEFVEANIVLSLFDDGRLPSPEELNVEYNTYLKGLAEAVGELRRRILDILIHGHSSKAELLLSQMDDIYAILVTMDYPDAVTGGLRRLTDIVRSITERTRGDLLISLRQEELETNLKQVEDKLDRINKGQSN